MLALSCFQKTCDRCKVIGTWFPSPDFGAHFGLDSRVFHTCFWTMTTGSLSGLCSGYCWREVQPSTRCLVQCHWLQLWLPVGSCISFSFCLPLLAVDESICKHWTRHRSVAKTPPQGVALQPQCNFSSQPFFPTSQLFPWSTRNWKFGAWIHHSNCIGIYEPHLSCGLTKSCVLRQHACSFLGNQQCSVHGVCLHSKWPWCRTMGASEGKPKPNHESWKILAIPTVFSWKNLDCNNCFWTATIHVFLHHHHSVTPIHATPSQQRIISVCCCRVFYEDIVSTNCIDSSTLVCAPHCARHHLLSPQKMWVTPVPWIFSTKHLRIGFRVSNRTQEISRLRRICSTDIHPLIGVSLQSPPMATVTNSGCLLGFLHSLRGTPTTMCISSVSVAVGLWQSLNKLSSLSGTHPAFRKFLSAVKFFNDVIGFK